MQITIEPLNLKTIIAYYKKRMETMIKAGLGFKAAIEAIREEVYEVNNFELGVYNDNLKFFETKSFETIQCTRCSREYKTSTNNTFCPVCGIIRFIYKKNDLQSAISDYKSPYPNEQYLTLPGLLIVKKQLYLDLITVNMPKIMDALKIYNEK